MIIYILLDFCTVSVTFILTRDRTGYEVTYGSTITYNAFLKTDLRSGFRVHNTVETVIRVCGADPRPV